MTGKCYYITTLGGWQRHASRFASSHFVVLAAPTTTPATAAAIAPTTTMDVKPPSGVAATASAQPSHADATGASAKSPYADAPRVSVVISGAAANASASAAANNAAVHFDPAPDTIAAEPRGAPASASAKSSHPDPPSGPITAEPSTLATKILVLVEADEGVHLALEDEPAFEALPHPLAQKPISDSAQAALAAHGVAPGATTFDAAEAVARVHPLLHYRVF